MSKPPSKAGRKPDGDRPRLTPIPVRFTAETIAAIEALRDEADDPHRGRPDKSEIIRLLVSEALAARAARTKPTR